MTDTSASTITRFAPSPTGFLHIGGARTALFNWLLARRMGGKYLLRIEDTDRARSTDEAIQAILDGLAWLGLDADDEPLFQFERQARHQEVVETLLANGHAYRCYCTPEELQAMRESAEAEGRPPIYDGRWRDRNPADAPADVKPAIRLKSSNEGETTICDQVQGDVTFQNANLDDLIILRSDGTPTYNLAVVVDDHDMGVSHVLRGVDHLTNAARQVQIYLAMGWPVPVFAHVPLIHGADGAKLSKRHGALGVEAYRAMGFLPSALKNYLVRLGWSHGDQEVFSEAEMIGKFGFDGLGKSPSRFDFAKLEDLNGQYIRKCDDDELIEHIKVLFKDMDDGTSLHDRFDAIGFARLEALMPAIKERAKTLHDLIDNARFLIAERPLNYDEKSTKALDADAKARLAELLPLLEQLSEWSATSIEAAIRDFTKSGGHKLGQVAQPLRAAMTGQAISTPIFDVVAVLPKDEAIARLRDATSS
ncbi:MAG: glutamate--tRNA ligase [Hyphomicrobiaceae bacterium]